MYRHVDLPAPVPARHERLSDRVNPSRIVRYVRAHPAMSADDLAFRADLVCLETYACATVPESALELTRRFVAAGTPVVAVPPSLSSDDDPHYPATAALEQAGAAVLLHSTAELEIPAAYFQ